MYFEESVSFNDKFYQEWNNIRENWSRKEITNFAYFCREKMENSNDPNCFQHCCGSFRQFDPSDAIRSTVFMMCIPLHDLISEYVMTLITEP